MNQNLNPANQQLNIYNPTKVKKSTVVFTALGIILYFADIISDICLAVRYYNTGHKVFFSLTLFLVILSAVVSSLLSFYMYRKIDKDTTSNTVWIIRAIFLMFGIAPVLRNFSALRYAWKYYHCKDKIGKLNYAQKMGFEITDGSYLKLYEAFLESGPQLVLQMYIFAETQSLKPSTFTETETSQCITMLISALSISSTIVAYSKSYQNSFCEEKKPKLFPSLILFLYRFFEVMSRIVAMSLGISATPYFHIVFILQYIVTVLLIYLKFKRPNHRLHGYEMYRIPLLSAILIFVYFTPEFGERDCFTPDVGQHKTRLFFYLVMFIENTATMIFWIFFSSPIRSLLLMATIIQGLSFCLSIMFMVIYYKCFQHSTEIQFRENSASNVLDNPIKNAEGEEIEIGKDVLQGTSEAHLGLRMYLHVS